MSRRRKKSSRAPGADAPQERSALDRDGVRAALLEGQSIELLQALGLVTERGGASPSAHRKIKQLAHFVRLLQPALDDVFARHDEPVLVDAAAGKSYVAFVLYELYVQRHGRGQVIAIEARDTLAARVEALARRSGYDRFQAIHGRIMDVALPERVHFMLALHACDTATDEAIVRAMRASSDHVAVVPCCQAEVSRLLQNLPGERAVGPLWRHAWHRREFGAQLTNVIRAHTLEACGYQTTVTELVGWEHAVKNEVILGRRVGRYHAPAREALNALLAEIPVRPWLLDVLADSLSAPSAQGISGEPAVT